MYVNYNLGSPVAGDTTAGVERIAQLFHRGNGDLCYANLFTDRVRTRSDCFEHNSPSARFRPWIPAAGNHEKFPAPGGLLEGPADLAFLLPERRANSIVLRGFPHAAGTTTITQAVHTLGYDITKSPCLERPLLILYSSRDRIIPRGREHADTFLAWAAGEKALRFYPVAILQHTVRTSMRTGRWSVKRPKTARRLQGATPLAAVLAAIRARSEVSRDLRRRPPRPSTAARA
ncbi:hypothetical protein [Streptomyces soliscabiei]|uniref:hypothetical protein n=1 Tax=Streptomyces soliscabiei TaxID=588897 RepID=UPI0029A40998|nr:hypothetical protein [Streptomyces sp. NY05-11A]MDX2675392.1 hypothetical protein [Streptomyces sp. NY05-11A]